jgi:hypothetical protein
MSASPSPQVGEPDEVPLSIEPVLGWRVWHLVRQGGEPRLRAIAHPTTWTPQEATRARCVRTSHGAPQRYCTCGYYATSSIDALAKAGVFHRGIGVIGAVAMWGTVIEHARGARSEYAYPARLRLVCSQCLQGGSIVDPVTVVEDTWLVPLCDRHSRSVGDRGLPASTVQADLLSAYGVELLPRPKLRGLRVASRNVTPANVLKWSFLGIFYLIRFLIGALFALWMLAAALVIMVAVISALVGAVTGETSASPSAVVSVAPTVPTTSYRVLEPHRGTPPPPVVPRMRLRCGISHGSWIDFAPCSSPNATLLGFAIDTPPRGPAKDCPPDPSAYSYGKDWNICWSAMPGTWVSPTATSANPFPERRTKEE